MAGKLMVAFGAGLMFYDVLAFSRAHWFFKGDKPKPYDWALNIVVILVGIVLWVAL